LAKNSDHLPGFETDDNGGVLSGLLAEEDELDRRSLWRIGTWGVGATAAVILAVMANQSSLGLKREQVAAVDLARQAQQIQTVARETHNEARRLAAAIDTLNSDRDRLYSRVTSLEHGLDSVTGTIARQGSIAAPGPVAGAEPHTVQNPAPAPAVATVATTQAVAPATEPGPAASSAPKDTGKTDGAKDMANKDMAKEMARSDAARNSFAKTEPSKTEPSKTEPSKTEPSKAETAKPESAAKSELAKSEFTKTNTAKSDTAKPEPAKADTGKTEAAKPTPAAPPMTAPLTIAPPDPAASKQIEPMQPPGSVIAGPLPDVVAAAPSSDADTEEDGAPKIALQRTEFGVDLGSANSVNGLRALWLGLLKSRSNAPLAALRPIIVVKEGTNGLGMQLRLVAGPLNDAGAAAKICAGMTENKRFCETTIFDGQRLALKSTDQQPAAERPAPRHRGLTKRAPTPVTVEEPPKPEPAAPTLSSMFGRKNSQ
jgi:hypothetical protein